MECFVADIKDSTEKLVQKQMPENADEVIEKLFHDTRNLESSSFSIIYEQQQLEDSAIQLWNWAVTKHVGSAINEDQKAKVRHAACLLLCAAEPPEPSEGAVRRLILMATKTGRTWLDCKMPKFADEFFCLAVKSLETLYGRLTARADDKGDINIPKGDVEKDLFRVLSYQAESALAQENHPEAVVCVQRCRDMLLRLPKETGYLSLMCYNFGVDAYNLKKFEESSYWLSQSYDIGKLNERYSPGAVVRAKILRLLATVYLEWDCVSFQEKALNAVSLANQASVQPSGLFLKIRILLKGKARDEPIRDAITELFESEVPLGVCLSMVKLLMEEDREALAFEFLKRVCQRFESSPELGSALVLHIELLLQRGKELLARQKIEDVITGHYTGKPLSHQTLSSLHLLLWDRASKNFEAINYSEALEWYNYSLSFYAAGQMEENLAKLQRNRASCFLHLGQLEKAREAIKEAERCDPDSIFTQFSVYKIAVLENDVDRAAEAVRAIGKLARGPVRSEDRLLQAHAAASGLLSLAAHIALEHDQQTIAKTALEGLCEHSEDWTQVLTALRCLVRLALSTMETAREEEREASLDALRSYLKMALRRVSQPSPMAGPRPGLEEHAEEANWFRKIAWNSALQCENSPERMRDFFVLSYQLSQFCLPDRAVLMGQKTCLLMATAARLELCRTSDVSVQQAEQLTEALEHIQICWEVWKALKASGDVSKDQTETLLLLYEFEARAKLSDPKLESVLEAVLELETVEPKTLETIAGLAMETPAHYPLLCKKALRIALALHKKQPQPDLLRCSRCLHSLVQLSLPSGVSEAEPRALEEAWGFYQEARSVIGLAPEDFPELEILWLLTRAWNTGILLYSRAQYPEAERWCGLAMTFLCHLGALQESYQTQMSGLYGEVLDKLDKAKRNLVMEE
ncbi:testis-expressed protein 11 [Conger conger]|uniref:testis-expressed protein 11 n=1 Tax=Conger conger TaxID=82655 RepID=UPI002A5AED21|nr:testis-expressed protein 11 [Conger conger]